MPALSAAIPESIHVNDMKATAAALTIATESGTSVSKKGETRNFDLQDPCSSLAVVSNSSRSYAPSGYGSHYAAHPGYYPPPDISPGSYRDRHHPHIPTDYYAEYSRREYDRRPPT